MAGATNWLTFSLTPTMEMQFAPYDNNFYGWTNSKQGVMDSPQSETQQLLAAVPKIEHFFDNQTEKGDSSSLTQIYEHDTVYFGVGQGQGQQDLNAIPGLHSAATNSGSEVDDSASNKTTRVAPTESLGAHSGESCKGAAALSLCNDNNNKTIAAVAVAVGVGFDTPKKVAHTFGQRTSKYRGVTRHRWTGRYEAHLWDNSCRREGQVRKGRQVYLGGYDKEDKAARAYDLAALKYWGPMATTNFPISNYTMELEEMKHVGKQEFIASLRRKSSGFSRGASAYRGVTRHHQQGRWQARIGRVAGNKDLYLGTFTTEEEAAEAYDVAAIKFRGSSAVTNFEMSRYNVEAIRNATLPIGGVAKRFKVSPEPENKPLIISGANHQPHQNTITTSSIDFSAIQPVSTTPYDSAAITYYPHNHLFHNFNPTSTTSEPTVTNNASYATALPTLLPSPLPALPAFFIWPHQNY